MNTANAYKQRKANYDNDAWATPWALFKELDAEFHFTLDVCATAENAKCARYFTKEQNGLYGDWSKDICFMNPPYSHINIWLEKAYMQAQCGAFVVCLVKADTSTTWWHHWYKLADEVRFLKRIQFVPPPGYPKKGGSPNMGSALLIFGKRGSK
jgi:phage N-6-adenine-methyltransferase